MNAQQIEILTDIQRLVLSGSEQTGMRMYHEVQPWGNGQVWSSIRVIEGSCEAVQSWEVVIHGDDDKVPDYSTEPARCTLTQQRDELAQWIADNRKKEAA